jgi:hypothetical protein
MRTDSFFRKVRNSPPHWVEKTLFQPIFLDLLLQSRALQAQVLGGLRLVPTEFFEGFADHVTFQRVGLVAKRTGERRRPLWFGRAGPVSRAKRSSRGNSSRIIEGPSANTTARSSTF